MVNSIEYIMCAVVLILIFSATAMAVVWVMNPVYNQLSRRDLYSVGDSLLDQFLGYSGDPAQWGSDITLSATSIRSIGLAKASNDYEALILDSSKLMRLTHSEVGTYVDPNIVRQLMNLQYRYDFNLRFIPALNLTITPTKNVTIGNGKNNKQWVLETDFNVKVTTHEQIRVANVNLTGYLLVAYVIGKGNDQWVNYSLIPIQKSVTDWKGEASFDLQSQIQNLYSKGNDQNDLAGTVFYVQGFYYGLKVNNVRASNAGDLLNATIVGNDLILGLDPKDPKSDFDLPQGTRKLKQGLVEGTMNGLMYEQFVDVSDKMPSWIVNYGSKNWRVYQISSVQPDIVFIAFAVKYRGNYCLVVATRVSFGQMGGIIPMGTEVADVRKLVVVDGLAYYADLHIWKAGVWG